MHFEINDVEFAEQSVARRMQGETWSFFERLFWRWFLQGRVGEGIPYKNPVIPICAPIMVSLFTPPLLLKHQ